LVRIFWLLFLTFVSGMCRVSAHTDSASAAKKLVQAASSPAHSHLFTAIALVHPTNLSPSDGDPLAVPVALIPSGGEDPDVMDAIWERLQRKEFAGKCVRRDFLEGHHGFASSRSDWNDPKLAAMAREAYEVMANFFAANL